MPLILDRFAVSAQIVLPAVVLATLVAVPAGIGGRHAAAVAAGVLDGPAAAPALCAEAGLVSRRGFRGLQRKPRPRAAVPGVAGGHAVAA
ncbi:hypothetical protein G6F35_018279 [Rhizopus arrhizus]|nr:hypothetical protein G6F35_018279 [Rhizopus arrhizus]